jgi:hypothetical protein
MKPTLSWHENKRLKGHKQNTKKNSNIKNKKDGTQKEYQTNLPTKYQSTFLIHVLSSYIIIISIICPFQCTCKKAYFVPTAILLQKNFASVLNHCNFATSNKQKSG